MIKCNCTAGILTQLMDFFQWKSIYLLIYLYVCWMIAFFGFKIGNSIEYYFKNFKANLFNHQWPLFTHDISFWVLFFRTFFKQLKFGEGQIQVSTHILDRFVIIIYNSSLKAHFFRKIPNVFFYHFWSMLLCHTICVWCACVCFSVVCNGNIEMFQEPLKFVTSTVFILYVNVQTA